MAKNKKNKIATTLKEKSVEAFLLGLELYNKPTIKYRIESATFLICNAWELLLKSKFVSDYGISSIYRKDGKTFSLEEIVKKFYTDNSPISINLLYIVENIRNKSTHYILDQHDILYTPLLQQSVINFVSELKKFFGIEVADLIPIDFITLIIKRDKKPVNLEKIYGKVISELFIKDENTINTLINKNFDEQGNCSIIATVNNKLSFVKNPNKADIISYYDKSGKALQAIEIPKDVNSTHPYTMNECITAVKNHFKKSGFEILNFHSSALVQYNKRNNISSNEQYFTALDYGTNKLKKYSSLYIRKLIEAIDNGNLALKEKIDGQLSAEDFKQ